MNELPKAEGHDCSQGELVKQSQFTYLFNTGAKSI